MDYFSSTIDPKKNNNDESLFIYMKSDKIPFMECYILENLNFLFSCIILLVLFWFILCCKFSFVKKENSCNIKIRQLYHWYRALVISDIRSSRNLHVHSYF